MPYPPVYGTPISMSKPTVIMNAKLWSIHEGNKYVSCPSVVERLPSGQYSVGSSDSYGYHLVKEEGITDDLLDLPDSVSAEVIEKVITFWTLENQFKEHGLLWKRGVLLYGPPGSGKTSILQILSKKIVEDDGIVIQLEYPLAAIKVLHTLRNIEPNRKVLLLLEDIDAIIDEYGESDLLSLLDGEQQINNIVFLATSNYPEKLDKRFKNRPSRFDIVKNIGLPSDKAREVFLRNKALYIKEEEIPVWVKNTKGFSIAHLKELIILVEIFNNSFENALQQIKEMIGSNPHSDDESKTNFGFTPGK